MAHAPALEADKQRVPEGHALRSVPKAALAVGIVGFVASLAMAFTGLGGEHALEQFYFSYLTAFMFFASLALGGMFFVLINLAARAGWSVTLRRTAENLAGTLPWMALLFVPILLGASHLYHHWMHAGEHDEILKAKSAWLNPAFFTVRAVVILAAWGLMGWWFRKESVKQDELGEREVGFGPKATTSSRRLQKLAGPCLFVYALTLSFAAFDWVMSLEPHWYSTIFGGYYFAGCVIAILALLVIVSMALQAAGLLGRAVTTEHYHDLGKFMFAFIVFWGYIGFSQFMLIWYANIPEETAWYHQRYQGSWMTISRVLLWGHFMLPFFFVIMRSVKRNRALLFVAAVYMIVVHYIDLHWLVMPTLHHDGFHPHLLDLTTFLAVGGVFVFAFMRLMVSAALVPVKDPRLPEALAFENF